MLRTVAATILLCLASVSAQARPSPYLSVTQYDGDRISARQAHLGPEVVRAVKAKTGAKARPKKLNRRATAAQRKWRAVPVPAPRPLAYELYRVEAPVSIGEGADRTAARVIGGPPAGCPSRYCGCGASLHLFGRIIPALNLAANWLRFPHAVPAPGMVAARRGHVFVLVRHVSGKTWIVHDSNSGGHRTRVHPRSIAGYQIVNPHGGLS